MKGNKTRTLSPNRITKQSEITSLSQLYELMANQYSLFPNTVKNVATTSPTFVLLNTSHFRTRVEGCVKSVAFSTIAFFYCVFIVMLVQNDRDAYLFSFSYTP